MKLWIRKLNVNFYFNNFGSVHAAPEKVNAIELQTFSTVATLRLRRAACPRHLEPPCSTLVFPSRLPQADLPSNLTHAHDHV